MIIIITFFIIIFCIIVAIVRSDKPLRLIFIEAKYELIYNLIGSRALFEDLLKKNSNKTDLPNKSGHVAVVTGGARGIGVEVVKMLMQCDMHVIVGCRNIAAGEMLETIVRNAGITTGEIQVFKLDVASLESVKYFARILIKKYPKIHLLINNAGIMFGPYVETIDGFESQFAVNYLGHFLLTHMLLSNIKAAGHSECKARIVNVSSCAHFAGELHLDDINYKKEYIASAAYGQSKLAQVLFTNYLEARFNSEGVPVQLHSVHPGIVNTDLFDGTQLKSICPWLPGLVFKSPAQGATSIVYAAVSPRLEGKGGSYISNCRVSHTNPLAKSVDLQEKLFNLSKNLVSIQDFGKVD